MWKLAMKMSLHNDSRLLQHFSRSMLSIGNHKHLEHRQSEDRLESSAKSSRRLQARIRSASASAALSESVQSEQVQPESERPSLSSRESFGSTHSLPPFPPIVFSPSKGLQRRPRGTSFQSYVNWTPRGLRPGLSVRVVRAEVIASVSSVTEYVLQVVDLHTKVFWVTKKRFHDFYALRKKIRDIIRHGDALEFESLKFILDLPFPRRRFRQASSLAVGRRMREIESFLRNVGSLEPTSPAQISVLREFQLSLCSAEFIASLEKIDTSEEPAEPKWLAYDLFTSLNSVTTIEGHTCYRFLQAFRNRCAVIEAAVCPECHSFADLSLATEALKDLRNVLTSIEKHVADFLSPKYADQFSLLDQSVDVGSLIDDCVYHAVEDTILVPLGQEISFLVEKTIDLEQEERLMKNIERMRGRSQAEFGIPEHLMSDDDWGKSCHHLSMIDERQLPSEKIHELLRSALEIFKSCGEKNLEWRENSALTADDYLPIHIYVVVHSGLRRPLMTKEYLGAMIHPSKMMGEVGYFLTMFEVALKYIADM
ncbi:hypothetical protein PINS_up002378 [Pythium insidiosum]|nr:hypothetical protein PINS_up002378 [Pythium insidiosum]